ncbi:MAG: ABC transporter permease [Aristaeellaceae bacterium]|nr:ABC transporter permease [Eubacteriales bacterium]
MNNADKRSGSTPSAAKRNNKTLVKFVRLILTPEIGMLIPIILICVLTNNANPVFLTWKFFSKILINSIPIGMMALGQALVTLTGDVDLSVGMNGCFAGIMMGVACDRWGLYTVCGSNALGLIVCMLIGLASGALIGAINGLLTSRFKLSSWITTLATQFICKGLVTTISQGITLDVKALGTKAFKDARPLSLSWLFFIFVLIILLLDIVVRRTSFGYKLRAVGGNPNAATMGGISVNKIRFLAFLLAGIFAALSGVFEVIQQQKAIPTSGEGREFRTIICVSIGGLSAGYGSIWGCAVGILLYHVVIRALEVLGWDKMLQLVLIGAILIVAVLMDIMRKKFEVKQVAK